MFRSYDTFAALEDSSWENIMSRLHLSRAASVAAAPTTRNFGGESDYDSLLEYFQAPWSLLRAVGGDRSYEGKTGYNLFTLIRLGNLFTRTNPVSLNEKNDS
jgi:hypothetical protein